MRQYELVIRIAQVHHLIDEHKYKKALTVIRTIDMKQVKGLSDLSAFAEVFTKTEQFDAAKATYLRIYKKSRTRRVLYRLIYLAIRTNALDEAESYYQEFVSMNPNARDALILRYRIDKASGAPIGDLIEILEALKEEEYIEEWAYELAKLYHKSGRLQECHDECDDIVLWFGHGEIVDRAKKLKEYIEKDTTIVYWDDTDFTDKETAEPNPDDTTSLPALDEYLQAKSRYERDDDDDEEDDDENYEDDGNELKESSEETSKAEETSKGKETSKAEEISKAEETSKVEKTSFEEDDINKYESISKADEEGKNEENPGEDLYDEENESDESDEFVDDYEDDFGDLEEADFTKIAKESLQKLSGLLKIGGKKEKTDKAEKPSKEVAISRIKESRDVKPVNIRPIEHHSQSGTGITQDLSKEIAAIVEAEHREQLKEKAVTIIKEHVNSVQEEEQPQSEEVKSESPVDVEEIGRENEFSESSKEVSAGEEILPDDLPTTRALHCSLSDILELIKGEPDPSHFVLVGTGQERIVGISKHIVKVMNECGYASVGRIAKINAKQLNEMKIDDFKGQLKGNCLLVDEAAELLFTTINKLFSLMDEYYGDFIVILADEGDTLDRLFKYTPSLGRRFKYIIDIHKFTEEDFGLS